MSVIVLSKLRDDWVTWDNGKPRPTGLPACTPASEVLGTFARPSEPEATMPPSSAARSSSA